MPAWRSSLNFESLSKNPRAFAFSFCIALGPLEREPASPSLLFTSPLLFSLFLCSVLFRFLLHSPPSILLSSIVAVAVYQWHNTVAVRIDAAQQFWLFYSVSGDLLTCLPRVISFLRCHSSPRFFIISFIFIIIHKLRSVSNCMQLAWVCRLSPCLPAFAFTSASAYLPA